MIIQPDFIEHWRTRMLVDLLDGDEMAPMYVIRILSHCNNRKKTQIEPMHNLGLKSLCRYSGDAEMLESALVESGWIEKTETGYDVPRFRKHNAQLFTSWENGSKGGRPRKKPKQNPTETQGKPTDNPTVTRENQSREEKSREELIKEKEKKETQPDGSGSSPDSKIPNVEKLDELISAFEMLPSGVGHQVRDRRGKEIIKGWKRVQKDPVAREAFEDIPTLMARIRDGTFLHGQGWFRLPWLFAKGQTQEWNVLKILDGNYERNEHAGKPKSTARVTDEASRDALKFLE